MRPERTARALGARNRFLCLAEYAAVTSSRKGGRAPGRIPDPPFRRRRLLRAGRNICPSCPDTVMVDRETLRRGCRCRVARDDRNRPRRATLVAAIHQTHPSRAPSRGSPWCSAASRSTQSASSYCVGLAIGAYWGPDGSATSSYGRISGPAPSCWELTLRSSCSGSTGPTLSGRFWRWPST